MRRLPTQPVQLALLVVGRADRELPGGAGQPLQRAVDLGQGVGPRAPQLEDLGAVDQALAAERDEVGIVVAPAAEALGPALRPMQVEQLLAPLDHGAVAVVHDHGRDLAGRDRRPG